MGRAHVVVDSDKVGGVEFESAHGELPVEEKDGRKADGAAEGGREGGRRKWKKMWERKKRLKEQQ
jgi:hypothetical protein